jgi:hypothetical protein
VALFKLGTSPALTFLENVRRALYCQLNFARLRARSGCRHTIHLAI